MENGQIAFPVSKKRKAHWDLKQNGQCVVNFVKRQKDIH